MCKMLLMCLNRFPRSAFSDNTNLAFMLLETASETRQEKGDKRVLLWDSFKHYITRGPFKLDPY